MRLLAAKSPGHTRIGSCVTEIPDEVEAEQDDAA
jgi:hypothetical protein